MNALSVRQARALVLLLFRHWTRTGVPGSRFNVLRRGSAVLVRIVVIGFFVQMGVIVGEFSLVGAAQGTAAVDWMLASLLGYSVCWGVLTRARHLRGMALPLAAPFLDTLPVHEPVRTGLEFLEIWVAHVLTVSAFVYAAPALPSAVSATLGMLTALAGTAAGSALMRWAFVLFPPERSAAFFQVATIAQAGFMMLVFLQPLGPRLPELFVLEPLARPLVGEGGVLGAVLFAAGLLGASIGALWLAERAGYDHVEITPRKRLDRSTADELRVGFVDLLLARREPGNRRWPIVAVGLIMLGSFAALMVITEGNLGEVRAQFTLFVAMVAWMGVPVGTALATRSVTRDLVARPFLASLPLEPSALLAGKVKAVREWLLVGLFPLAFMLLAPLEAPVLWDIALATVFIGGAFAIFATAAVSVAFLTGGAASAHRQPTGTFRLETLLVLMPLVAILIGANSFAALVPLTALGLVAFEARRAALRVVRWLDDGEEFERETAAWRACLVFAAFQATQMLTLRLTAFWTKDPGVLAGMSYAVSGAVLVALTLHGRRDLAPIRLLPKNPAMLAIGVGGGVLAALVARFALSWLAPGGPRTGLEQLSTETAQLLFALTTVTLAPLVEEVFFRGWLQPAIAGDLPANRRWLAPFIAALAFAAVHPALAFPGVFSVGLVAGALYARTGSLAPAIFAHAAYNLALLLGG